MTDFPKRSLKNLPNGYTEKVGAMDENGMKEELYKLQKSISDSQKDMDNDENVLDARAKLEEEEGPYKDSIKASKLMVKYICHEFRERGIW